MIMVVRAATVKFLFVAVEDSHKWPLVHGKEATVGYICLRPSAAGLVIGRWREGFYDMLSSTL